MSGARYTWWGGSMTREQRRLVNAALDRFRMPGRNRALDPGLFVYMLPSTRTPEYIELRRRDDFGRIIWRRVIYAKSTRGATVHTINALLKEVGQNGTTTGGISGAEAV